MTARLEITILGCGSSAGVPRIGGLDGAGDWGACDPSNPKNRRRRCSLLVRRGETAVLVDTTPDLREQMLSARCRQSWSTPRRICASRCYRRAAAGWTAS